VALRKLPAREGTLILAAVSLNPESREKRERAGARPLGRQGYTVSVGAVAGGASGTGFACRLRPRKGCSPNSVSFSARMP
jgi:hypothetical protein